MKVLPLKVNRHDASYRPVPGVRKTKLVRFSQHHTPIFGSNFHKKSTRETRGNVCYYRRARFGSFFTAAPAPDLTHCAAVNARMRSAHALSLICDMEMYTYIRALAHDSRIPLIDVNDVFHKQIGEQMRYTHNIHVHVCMYLRIMMYTHTHTHPQRPALLSAQAIWCREGHRSATETRKQIQSDHAASAAGLRQCLLAHMKRFGCARICF